MYICIDRETCREIGREKQREREIEKETEKERQTLKAWVTQSQKQLSRLGSKQNTTLSHPVLFPLYHNTMLSNLLWITHKEVHALEYLRTNELSQKNLKEEIKDANCLRKPVFES